ncbi:carboxypeptidase regulatory-like domain-containing protein [Paenibacillus sp. J5C_2022]|uniref:carboxypeptidase regulatory-like domain-containing protein n=1 Tax=Paenibacillus sp. J5C2022 TaxID=2977129 RepID=UPI0021D28B7E|nr:carboxypeptidase regulatory-like domain-containing protein [Paenibacillus sp. J5C2022]MCU6708753.1 carboxypeptidase regulatory-like domain-containing protein [Paenibacillus sp. J5C2022]
MEKRLKMSVMTCLTSILLLSSIGLTPNASADSESQTTGVIPQPIQYESDKWAVLPKVHRTPSIDGVLDEDMWTRTAEIRNFQTAYYNQSLNDSVKYQVAYDNGHVYIGGSIAREEADSLAQIAVILQPQGSEEFYAIEIPMNTAASPNLSPIWNPSPDVSKLWDDIGKVAIDSAQHASSADEEEVYVELAVPIADIVPAGVEPGDEWQMNIVHLHNLYTRPLSSWVPIRHSDQWHQNGPEATVRIGLVDEERFGSIMFSRLPLSLADIGGDSLLSGQSGQLQLLYNGFTEKRLSIDMSSFFQRGEALKTTNNPGLELQWKEPGQPWTSLEQQEWSWNGQALELEFQHPAPMKRGLYQLRIVLFPDLPIARTIAMLSFDREAIIAAGEAAYDMGQGSDNGASLQQLEWSEASEEVERIMALIPPQPGYRFVGLPELPELYPSGLYQLSEDGHSLTAPRTGTVYPNAQFAEDNSLSLENGKGENVTIPYYENNEGQRFFITAHMWYLQKARAITQTGALGESDPLGAARLLYAFAQAYEGYNPTVDRVGGSNHANLSLDKRSGPPFPYWGGIWERWWYNDLPTIKPLLRLYKELKGTNAFQLLSDEYGEDVEQRIVQNMIVPSAEFVLSRPEYLGNMSFQTWKGLIEVGMALDEPEYIHRVLESVQELVDTMFLSDGYWQEVTPSYHIQTISGLLAVAELLQGWSDPAGYVSPRDGKRFDNLQVEQQFPSIGRAIENANKLVYPDGKVLPITDTWANQVRSNPLLDAGSFLLPAAKIGRLTGGDGEEQTQLYMGFQPKYGHAHYDPLNLSLYAQGQELMPDLGYTHNTFYRWFALSTMAHNTVVVDSANMVNGEQAKHGGNISAFVEEGHPFQAMRADYDSAYEATETYSREPWFVPFGGGSGEQGYVLDLFRVQGGSRHEYTLQGDANRDARFETDAQLTDYGPYLLPPGTEVVLPTNNSDSGSAEGHYPGYIYVQDVQQAELDSEQYEVTLVTEDEGAPGAKMKVTGLLESGQNELFLGRSPSLRSIRLQGTKVDNNDEAVKYTMPKLVLRREGTDLNSTFVTLMEPYSGEQTRIEAIDRLQLDQAPAGAVAVKVVYGNTTDIIVSNPEHPDEPVTTADMTMVGEMGFIRLVNGEVWSLSLVGGTLLRMGEQEIHGDGDVTGDVIETRSAARGDAMDAIVVTGVVPEHMAGQYVTVRHPDQSTSGYKVEAVQHESGNSVLVLAEHDPGFSIGENGTSRQTYYPGLQWTGTHTIRLQGSVSAQVQGAAPVKDSVITGTVTDGDGSPLAGATVNLSGYANMATNTDTEGTFTLQVPAGQHRVTVLANGYARTVSTSVYAAHGETANLFISVTAMLPPVITDATLIGQRIGGAITATSNVDAAIHLVPADTPVDKGAIEAASASGSGTSIQATSNSPAELNTAGLSEGIYMLYAIRSNGLLSAGHRMVLLPQGLTAIDDDNPFVTYTGNWRTFQNNSYAGGTQVIGVGSQDVVEIPFYGTSATLIADRHTARGKGNVYVDGEYVTTIDFYNYPIMYQVEVFNTGELMEGMHVIRLESIWEKSPQSSNPFISFDELRITTD